MMKNQQTDTIAFKSDAVRKEHIKNLLTQVCDALTERGYNAVNQLAGYLISNDPAYISSYKNARTIIQSIERHELIEELVRSYLDD
jgi:uncharacterized protein (UPF0297 family)